MTEQWWIYKSELDSSGSFRDKFTEVEDILRKIMTYSNDVEARKLAFDMLHPLQKFLNEEKKRELKEFWEKEE
jgi:hypothetical protein